MMASDVVTISTREAGGDNEVPRDHNDRPRIILPCPGCDGSGRVPSEKKPAPATIKCPKGCGPTKADEWIPVGKKAVAHTRVTTFIDVLEDKSNLMAWKGRMTLLGAALDPSFLEGVDLMDPEEKADKDRLNRLAESAQTVAGASLKAEKGTHLHGLSELVDQGIELPDAISFGDVIDMDAYKRRTRWFKIRHMEKLVVNSEYKVAGTPDRVSSIDVAEILKAIENGTLASDNFRIREDGSCVLVAPDGTEIEPHELVITDLKTGTVEYGALKMAMQLSIYANSNLYDHKTGEQTPMENVNLKWGIIMHLPAGLGECTLYWADLTLGWEAVGVAYLVRDLRRRGKGGLVKLVS